MYKIFIVEDDEGIANGIASQLKSWGHETFLCEDFNNVINEFVKVQPHIVLLDISLPFFNGFHWCNEIRKISKVPIVFISSASENMNIVMAMNMGADDFVAKPFDLNVLVAKVSALLRRTYDFAESVPVLECRGAMLNTGDGTVTYEGNKAELTKNELKILSTLMKERGKTVSREKLMEILWESDSFVDENTLTVNVNRLRKKLESLGLTDFISTRFGEGYIIKN
ncbi:MAG: response regulator transcription factor [Lachnospiraceae bacterium]|jgi:DNA-binding response OmpR family regulator|nr:response regulator transcription factor [Lachnospiraceae bacterium]